MKSRSQYHPARGSLGLGRRKERNYTLKEWSGALRVLGAWGLIKEICLAWGHSPRLQGNVQVRAWAMVGTGGGGSGRCTKEVEMGRVEEERRRSEECTCSCACTARGWRTLRGHVLQRKP